MGNAAKFLCIMIYRNLLFYTENQFPPVQLESDGGGDNVGIIAIIKDWINLCNF